MPKSLHDAATVAARTLQGAVALESCLSKGGQRKADENGGAKFELGQRKCEKQKSALVLRVMLSKAVLFLRD